MLFHNLPSRKLTDYYALIKRPVSLKGIQKRVQGVHGRQEKTGISDFKTWDAFADEMSYIWRNAREYNEDGSEIVAFVGQLEVRWPMMRKVMDVRLTKRWEQGLLHWTTGARQKGRTGTGGARSHRSDWTATADAQDVDA